MQPSIPLGSINRLQRYQCIVGEIWAAALNICWLRNLKRRRTQRSSRVEQEMLSYCLKLGKTCLVVVCCGRWQLALAHIWRWLCSTVAPILWWLCYGIMYVGMWVGVWVCTRDWNDLKIGSSPQHSDLGFNRSRVRLGNLHQFASRESAHSL